MKTPPHSVPFLLLALIQSSLGQEALIGVRESYAQSQTTAQNANAEALAKAPASTTVPVPPAPSQWVTDSAGMFAPATTAKLNVQLRQFEQETTAQVIVYSQERIPAGITIEDYVTLIMNSWGIGMKGKNNGVGLFIFSGDKKVRLGVGSGLEASLTNERAKTIVDTIFVPRMKEGNFDAAVTNTINSILPIVRDADVQR